MASRETRAFIAASGDVYLCPLPQVQLTEGEFDAALEAVGCGDQPLTPVVRANPQGEPELIAAGYEYGVARWTTRFNTGRNDAWWCGRFGRRTQPKWRFEPGCPRP